MIQPVTENKEQKLNMIDNLIDKNPTTLSDKVDEELAQKINEFIDACGTDLKELFEKPSPPNDEPYVLLVLNSTRAFYHKYRKYRHIPEDMLESSPKETNEQNQIVDLNSQSRDKKNEEKNLIPTKPNKNSKALAKKAAKKKARKKKKKKLAKAKAKEKATKKVKMLPIEQYFSSPKKCENLLSSCFENDYFKIPFSSILETYKKKYNKSETMNYEDAIKIILTYIKISLGISMRLELSEDSKESQLYVLMFGDEEFFEKAAFKLSYYLQIKPYAYKYEIARAKLFSSLQKEGKSDDIFLHKNVNMSLADKKYDEPIQFEDCDLYDAAYWPPYKMYEKRYDNKFRRYEKDDSYHECPIDDINDIKKFDQECGHCSKFRNIDKLRLIYDSFDKAIKTIILKKVQLVEDILYRRNYISYGDKLEWKNVIKSNYPYTKQLLFKGNNFKKTINLMRNFFGEEMAYYFLWVDHLMTWLIIPSIVGLIITILDLAKVFGTKTVINNSPITVKDLVMLVFAIFVIVYMFLFKYSWEQKENVYRYLWGTEDSQVTCIQREDFVYDQVIHLILGKKTTSYSGKKRTFKKILSFFVLIVMVLATSAISFLFIDLKKKCLRNNNENNFWFNTFISVGFSVANTVQIKIFNFIYTFLAEKFNNWENYKTYDDADDNLATKMIIFDFFNCYSPLYYIGFYKPYTVDGCVGVEGGCVQELSTQIYTTLLINAALDILEVGTPILMFYVRRYFYYKDPKNANKKIALHSIRHQRLCDKEDSMIYEFNELLTLFGYLCLFCVVAPLTPLLVFILVYIEKLFDLIKLLGFINVDSVDPDNGIGKFKTLIKVIIGFGAFSNCLLLVFSKETKSAGHVKTKDQEHIDYLYKTGLLIIMENITILALYIAKYRVEPGWFGKRTEIQHLYDSKYINCENKHLPHLYIADDDEDKDFVEEDAKEEVGEIEVERNDSSEDDDDDDDDDDGDEEGDEGKGENGDKKDSEVKGENVIVEVVKNDNKNEEENILKEDNEKEKDINVQSEQIGIKNDN